MVATGVFAATSAAAQDTTDGSGEVRIVARKLDDGRIEFGLQQRQADDSWGNRQLPRVRFFPTTATIGRWLASSPLGLPAGEVRIVARKLDDGRIEFGLQQRQADDSWGDRQLPRVRFFPTTATIGRWLASSPLTLTAPQAAGQYTASTPGDTYTCTLRGSSTLTCIGQSLLADPRASDGQYTALAAGIGHTCGLRSDGTITCWGSTYDGQTDAPADAPAGQYTAITTGESHSCALAGDGAVTCWGANWHGQTTDAPAGRYTAISAGDYHTCALRTDDTLVCWGSFEDFGGSGPVIDVLGEMLAGQYTAIASGSNFTCALGTDGTVTCGGWSEYVGKAPAGRYTAISAGDDHTCALRTDDTLTCWGDNYYGQTDAPAGRYTAISAGDDHTCALRTDDTLTCWGDDATESGPRPDRPRG